LELQIFLINLSQMLLFLLAFILLVHRIEDKAVKGDIHLHRRMMESFYQATSLWLQLEEVSYDCPLILSLINKEVLNITCLQSTYSFEVAVYIT
jgi:hypothetical protein